MENPSDHKARLIFEILLIIIILVLAGVNLLLYKSGEKNNGTGTQDNVNLYNQIITPLLTNQTKTMYVPFFVVHDFAGDQSYQKVEINNKMNFTYKWKVMDELFKHVYFINKNSSYDNSNEFNYNYVTSGNMSHSTPVYHNTTNPPPEPIGHPRGDLILFFIWKMEYSTFLIENYQDHNGNQEIDNDEKVISNWIEVNYTIEYSPPDQWSPYAFEVNPESDITKALSWLNVTPTNEDLIFIKSGNASKNEDMGNIELKFGGTYHNSSFEIPIGDIPITEDYSIDISLTRHLSPGEEKYINYKIYDDDTNDYYNYSLFWDAKFGTLYMEVGNYRLTNPYEKY